MVSFKLISIIAYVASLQSYHINRKSIISRSYINHAISFQSYHISHINHAISFRSVFVFEIPLFSEERNCFYLRNILNIFVVECTHLKCLRNIMCQIDFITEVKCLLSNYCLLMTFYLQSLSLDQSGCLLQQLDITFKVESGIEILKLLIFDVAF